MATVIPRPGPGVDFLSEILEGAGVNSTSAVRVTGRDGLAPLIWLCRRGFEDVAYVRPGVGGPHDCGDVLLVLHNVTLAELERLLSGPCHVREGGVLVVQTLDQRRADGVDPVHSIFERAGYRVERCLPRHSGEVHVARRAA